MTVANTHQPQRRRICPTANRALPDGFRTGLSIKLAPSWKSGISRPTAIGHNQKQIAFENEFVTEPNTNQIREALEFSRFRFKLIEFFKLPSDIREFALREELERACAGVFRNYLARAERVAEILKSEDAPQSDDTLEMKIQVLPALAQRHSDSPNT